MKIKILLASLILLSGLAFGQGQFSGGGGNGGGGGSGTVSANNGQTNVIATYAVAGGSTTVGPAASTNPSACLPGSTSGEACLTAPAVAGTSTNLLNFSNSLVVPASNGNGYFISNNTEGMRQDTNGLTFNFGADKIAVGSAYVAIDGGSILAFSSPGSIGTRDTAISRLAAGSLSTDTSTAGNGLSAITNCRTTVNVTPVTVNASVTTDQNLMAFTLPANCLNTVGRTLRVFVAGVYSTAATSTAQMTLKIKVCSVSGCATGNVASVINIQSAALSTLTITNNAWNGTFYITTQTGSTAGAWEAHGAFGIDEGALATAADSFFNDTNTATVTGSPSAIDTTAQNFLQISFAFSAASASNSATQRQLVIDSVN